MWYEGAKKNRESARETSAKSAPRLRIISPQTDQPSDLPPNRHCNCINNAMDSYQGLKKWTINPNSDLISSMNGKLPIQQRTKQIIQARNYRLQLQRQLKARKQKELEDMQMKKAESPHRKRRKQQKQEKQEKLPVFGSILDDHIKREHRLEEAMLREEIKEMELLRIAMLKQQQLESTLVARLKQLSPYVRRTHYLDPDLISTPTNFRGGTRAMPLHPDSSPYFKENYHRASSPTASSPYKFSKDVKDAGRIKPQLNKYLEEFKRQREGHSADKLITKRNQKRIPKDPRELRRVLQNNKQQIATFLEGLISRNIS